MIKQLIDPRKYNSCVNKMREFFLKKNFVEVHTQNALSILAACEDGFVQEWIHGEDKIKEHQDLFYKHTAEFLERHKQKLSEIA